VLLLVIDSSTPAVTAALARLTDGGEPEMLAEQLTVNARAHGELLAPHVAAVLEAEGVRPGDLGAVVAGLGPGPFTGLRVGLVTAAAMSDALDIPGYGVCSLDAFGYAVAHEGLASERVLVATDARRREVYWSVYEGGKPLTEPGVGVPVDVASRAADLGATAAVGEGAQRYAEVLAAPGKGLTVRPDPAYPPAAALAALAADRARAGAPGERLIPLYLRRPDAVAPGARKAVLPP
jgi:tRNA threonylcarbamoyl adenosine modification protein YeaZ